MDFATGPPDEVFCKEVCPATGQKSAKDENAGLPARCVAERDCSTTAKQPTHKAVASTSTAGTSTRLPQASGSATGTSKEPPQDFTYLPDGSLHLRNGIVLTKVQASRIISHKKSSLVVKETAQAIWTQSGLAMRSVKGGVAPRKRGTAETAKPRLTPEKVEVVAATLEHWGKVNKNDITAAMKNLTNILCEKIQDCVKSERRQQLTQQALL
ncbi:BEN domain-containing protein 5-like isoform X3 [Amblyomma americanum]